MADDNIVIKINLDDSDFANGADDVQNRLNSIGNAGDVAVGNMLSNAIQKASEKMLELGKKVYEIGTAFEKSFAKASTLVPADVAIGDLRQNIIGLSNDTGMAADALNEGLYQALSAGVQITGDGSDAVSYLNQAVKLAEGGFTDMSTAVDATTTVLNAYGMKQSDVTKVSDILIATQNEGKTSVGELGAVMGQVVPTAANLGINFEQVGATLAAMTAQGIPTAQAATQLRQAMVELSKGGQQASNAFMEAAGVSFPEFIKNGGTMQEAMQLMSDYAARTGKRINDLFGSVEAANTALVLASDTGSKKFIKSLDTMYNSAGATDEAFEKVTNTVGYKMEKAFNKMKNSAIKVFDGLAPSIELVSDIISKLGDALNLMPKPMADFVAGFGAVIAVAGPAVIAIGLIKTAITQLGIAINTALPIIGLIGIAVGAVVAGVNAYNERMESLEKSSAKYYEEGLQKRLDALEKERESIDTTAKSAESFEANLAELQGVEVNPTVDIEVKGAIAEIEGLQGIFFDIAVGGEDAAAAVEELNQKLDDYVTAQKNAAAANLQMEMSELASAYNSHRITLDEYIASCDNIMARYTSMNEGFDQQKQVMMDLANGTTDSTSACLAFAEAQDTIGANSDVNVSKLKTVAQAVEELQTTYANGEGEQMMEIRTENLNAVLGDKLVARVGAANDALDIYHTKMKEASDDEAEATAYAEEYIATAQEKEGLYRNMSAQVDNYATANERATQLELANSKELVTQLRQDMFERLGTTEITQRNLQDLADSYHADMTSKEEAFAQGQLDIERIKNANLTEEEYAAIMERGGIVAEYENDRIRGAQELASKLEQTTSDWSQEELNQLRAWAEATGVAIDESALSSTEDFQNMINGWCEVLNDPEAMPKARDDVIAEMEQLLPGLSRTADSISAKYDETGKAVSNSLDSAGNSATTLNANLDSSAQSAEGAATSIETVGTSAQDSADNVNGAADSISGSYDNVGSSAEGAASDTESATSDMTSAVEDTASATDGAASDMGASYEDMSKSAEDSSKSIASAGTNVEQTETKMAQTTQTASANMSDSFATTASNAEFEAHRINTAIASVIKSIEDVNSKTIKINVDRNIALPHFKLHGSLNAGAGTVPSVSVDWYRKGGIFYNPTIAGVGDVPEAAVPLDKLVPLLAEAWKEVMQDNAAVTNLKVIAMDAIAETNELVSRKPAAFVERERSILSRGLFAESADGGSKESANSIMDTIVDLLTSIRDKSTDIYLDKNKVGRALDQWKQDQGVSVSKGGMFENVY